jgi:hypothetical protein
MEQTLVLSDNSASTNARLMLGLMLIALCVAFAGTLVGMRDMDVGTDTYVYAGVFDAMKHHGLVQSRFEPVFYYLTAALAATGISVKAYQAALFLVMIAIVIAATRRYHAYLLSQTRYMTFLVASLLFLFISPVMSNATINVVRQGLASLLVFTALLAFYQRQWRGYFLWGLLAAGFHYSAVLYLVFAPVLLLKPRTQLAVGVLAFLAYCSGLTMMLVRALAPPVYTLVMAYDGSATYRAGVRLDFALFSLFWYLLPYGVAKLVREPVRERITHGMAVYLVLMLPFFAVGWGNFSNRYLLPAWLSVSLVLAAICCDNRLTPLRNPVVLGMGLVAACGVFYFYVSHGLVL